MEEAKNRAREQVKAPAIALVVVGSISAVARLVYLILCIAMGSVGSYSFGTAQEQMAGKIGQVVGFGLLFLVVLLDGFVLFAGLRMLNLRNYGLVMAAAVVACVPCCSPMCVLGIPFGIWALVVLNNAEVKSAFE